jgi:hypothetical protein
MILGMTAFHGPGGMVDFQFELLVHIAIFGGKPVRIKPLLTGWIAGP